MLSTRGASPVNRTLRAAFKTFVFVGMLALYYVAGPGEAGGAVEAPVGGAGARGRQLLNSSAVSECWPAELVCKMERVPSDCLLMCTITGRDALTEQQIRAGGVAFYILGSIYMFFALSIVCDEFFVPSLEIIAEKAKISHDVAGATLMAAGGSAPELFTSFIGTFNESAVGFGTIVGSAVFNVLFVVAMCALFSKEVLTLTWWPLFRDCIYYTMSLSLLALFFSVITPNQIDWYEALILFVLYIGYVVLMAYHLHLYRAIERCRGRGKNKVEPVVTVDGVDAKDAKGDKDEHVYVPRVSAFNRPSNFRAGICQLMLRDKPLLDTAATAVVQAIQGNALETFNQLDEENTGFLNKNEIGHLLNSLGSPCGEGQIMTVFKALDRDHDGKIEYEEFQAWYIRSEQRIHAELKLTFDTFDSNNNKLLDRGEIKCVLQKMHPLLSKEELDLQAMVVFKEMTDADDQGDQLHFDDFERWYLKSDLFANKHEHAKLQADEAEEHPLFPFPKSWGARVTWVFLAPLTFPLHATIPPFCGKPGPKWRQLHWGLLGFVVSIMWIGVYSFLMVWWVEVAGATFGIPPVVMGLTFLAAGTSVPDLLSSIIVAKRGQGDMAVSSSLGSNIFDVLVGLPLPWLVYGAYTNGPVTVKADGIGLSIGILIAMLVAVVGIVALNGWRMTKMLGGAMFVMYFVFVLQDLLRYFL